MHTIPEKEKTQKSARQAGAYLSAGTRANQKSMETIPSTTTA
jgi:hypothetical protein